MYRRRLPSFILGPTVSKVVARQGLSRKPEGSLVFLWDISSVEKRNLFHLWAESCSCTSTMSKTRDVLPIGSTGTTFLRLQQSSDDQSRHDFFFFFSNRLEIRAQLPWSLTLRISFDHLKARSFFSENGFGCVGITSFIRKAANLTPQNWSPMIAKLQLLVFEPETVLDIQNKEN